MVKIKNEVDFRNHTAHNLPIEGVDALPVTAVLGRIVRMDGFLYMFGTDGWKRCGNDITQSLDDVADDTVPSSSLVRQLAESNEESHEAFIARMDALEERDAELKVEIDTKTDITMAIGTWDSKLTYPEDATVMLNGVLYYSKVDGNIGHNPEIETEADVYWGRIKGGAGGESLAFVIGDGLRTSFLITHGLGSYNFVYAIRTNDEDREYIDGVVQAVSVNTARVTFTKAPAENGVVVIFGAGGSGGGGGGGDEGKIEEFAVSEESSVWTIKHGFDSYVLVQVYDENGNEVLGDVQCVDRNTVELTFGHSIKGTAVIAGVGNVSADEYTFSEASNEWTMTPMKGRYCLVQTYDSNGKLILGDVHQDVGAGTVTVYFNELQTGTAVVY